MEQYKGAMEKLDPLHRVFLHNGRQFQTADGIYYQRTNPLLDTISRQIPKVRGKSARRADKRARQARRKA